jgi:hypothetical protein
MLNASDIAMVTLERQLAQELNADSLYLTAAGLDLHTDKPAILDACLKAAQTVSHTPNVESNGFKSLGTGNFSHVYGLAETDELCIKLVSPRTQNTHKNGRLKHLPNLLIEAKYMNLLSSHLSSDRFSSGVRVPEYFGVINFGAASVSLLERVPDSYVTLSKLWNDANHNRSEEAKIDHQGRTAHRRLTKALGISMLRLGVGDAKAPFSGGVNKNNFMVPQEGFTGEEDFYAIDLYGGFKLKQRLLGAGVVRLAA